MFARKRKIATMLVTNSDAILQISKCDVLDLKSFIALTASFGKRIRDTTMLRYALRASCAANASAGYGAATVALSESKKAWHFPTSHAKPGTRASYFAS
jgi:hypothetical protein